jgi:hypothetical protein
VRSRPTFQLNPGVGIDVCGGRYRFLDALFVVIAVNLIAVLVNKRGVPKYDFALKAGVLDDL